MSTWRPMHESLFAEAIYGWFCAPSPEAAEEFEDLADIAVDELGMVREPTAQKLVLRLQHLPADPGAQGALDLATDLLHFVIAGTALTQAHA